MKIIDCGHTYDLKNLDGEGYERIHFVNRNPGGEREGTTNQEVLRALIDRVLYLDAQVPWEGNKKILKNLRMALVLHEARHLERLVEKNQMFPELVEVSKDDGHFKIDRG